MTYSSTADTPTSFGPTAFSDAHADLITKRMRQFAYILAFASMVILFRWIKIPRDQIYLFDVAREVNFWTWMNVAYMLFAAQVIWLTTWLRRGRNLPWTGWALAGLALVLLSLDDFISIHERLDPLKRRLFKRLQ